jgi:hypothetical protein
MKKIRKLIELYYEHKLDLLKRDMRVNWATEREIEVVDIEKVEEDELEKNLNKLSELKPFIKWLVENDKIDLDKTWYKKADFQEVWNWDWRTVRWYEMLLMLLAIQDEPIQFLIKILKQETHQP